MTEPEKDEPWNLQSLIEGADSGYTAGAGAYFYWFLAHHVRAEKVKFSDLFIDEAKSEYNSRTGRVFLITNTSIIFAEFTGAAEEDSRDQSQDFGTVTVTMHSKSHAPVASLTWADRSLRVKKSFGGGTLSARLDKGSITVSGSGWAAKLPSRSIDGGDEYFSRLREALGLS